MKKTLGIVIGVLILAIIVLAGMGVFKSEDKKALNDDIVAFADCLKDEGAKFYGAFWCPHCQDQHRMFGRKGSEALPYIECSTPDSKGQTEVCTEAGIESYPTWEFADGSRVGGVQSVQDLSEKTSCPPTPAMVEFYKVDETAAVIEALTPEEITEINQNQ